MAGAAIGFSVVGIWAGIRMYICILSALFQGLWRRYYHGDAWAGRPAIYNWCMHDNFPGRYLTPVRLHFEGEKPDLDSAIWVSMHFTILDWVFCVCGNDQISFCAGMKPFAFGLSLGHLLYFPLVAAHYFDGRNILLPASQGYKGFERWIAKTKHPWVYPAGLGTRFRSGAFRAAMATGKPVVPVQLKGVKENMNRFCMARSSSIDVTLVWGKPLYGKDFEDVEAFRKAAEEACSY